MLSLSLHSLFFLPTTAKEGTRTETEAGTNRATELMYCIVVSITKYWPFVCPSDHFPFLVFFLSVILVFYYRAGVTRRTEGRRRPTETNGSVCRFRTFFLNNFTFGSLLNAFDFDCTRVSFALLVSVTAPQSSLDVLQTKR